jgi:hypothetical protein
MYYINSAQEEIKTIVGALPDAGALTTIAKEATLGTPTDTSIAHDIANAQTAIDLIKAVTDVLPNAGALTDLAQASVLGTPADTSVAHDIANVQTDVTAIKAVTDVLSSGNIVRKTVTFSNTTTDVTTFTVTGAVKIQLYAVCTTSIASAAGCTIALKAGTFSLIGATDCTALAIGEFWNDSTPTEKVGRYYDIVYEYCIGDGSDIVIDLEDAKQVDSGVVEFMITWQPITSDGNVVAAA